MSSEMKMKNILFDNPYMSIISDITEKPFKVISETFTPDFFDYSLNKCDMTQADKEFGEGSKSIFLYKLSNINHQWTNGGAGTFIIMKIQHKDNFRFSEDIIKELIQREFAEYMI